VKAAERGAPDVLDAEKESLVVALTVELRPTLPPWRVLV